MSRIDYCVTTMDRPQALERLLLSLAAHRPEAGVHVADQSESFDAEGHERLAERLLAAGLCQVPTIHRLPFDCGLSAARNHLVDSTPGAYKLALDDDFVFDERTDVDAMARLLDAFPTVGVVGGSVSRNGRIRNVGTLLRKCEGSLCQLPVADPLKEHGGVRFRRTDCVPMFALMRREVFSHVRWDPALKVAGEHFDFFLRLSETSFTVLHTPDAIVDHPPIDAEPGYRLLRWRGELLARMLNKHGLTRIEAINGVVTELRPDGELVQYCRLEGQRSRSAASIRSATRSQV
jgi:GT2 family glycosyltransferase